MATLKRRALSALMALVLVLGLLPGGVLAYEGESDSTGIATITVVDEAGDPLEDVTVYLHDRDSREDPWSVEPVDQQITDENGQAVFTILKNRSYKARAEGGGDEPTFRLGKDESEVQDIIKLKAPGNDGENGASPVPPADNGNHFQSYTFQDTGSQNVKIYYSIGGADIQEMTLSSSIQVNGSQPVMFFVGATDGSHPVTDFTDASDNQAKEIQSIQNAPSRLNYNNRSYTFSNAIRQAEAENCTMEFHYSQFAQEYRIRTFCFVTDKTQLSISYEWNHAPSGETLPANDTVTYGTSYTVDRTYSKGTTVTVGDTTYVFSGWTASNDQAWVSSNGVDGTVKGNVVFSGSWTVKEQTYQAAFFLRIDRKIQYEDGTTHYSSVDYLPEHQADGTGHFWGKISGTASVEGGEKTIVTDLTKLEVAEVQEKFQPVSNVIVSAPSLTGTSSEDLRFQQMVLSNFAVTAQQLQNGDVGVIWYVAKEQDSSVCHYHVDGVLYNTKTGAPILPKYKLTVTHEYYTYWLDGTTEKGLTQAGSTQTVYTNEEEKTVTVNSLQEPSYGENNYTFSASIPDVETITYSQNGASITLKYKRQVAAPQLNYSYTFQYHYKAMGETDYTTVALTPEQQTSVTTSVGPVSEYPTLQALWNSVGTIPDCPVETYAGSYTKAPCYTDGEVTQNGNTYTIHVYLEQAPYQFAVRYQLFDVVNGVVQTTPVATIPVSADNNYGPGEPSKELVLNATRANFLDTATNLYTRYDVYDSSLTYADQVTRSGKAGGTGSEQLTYTVNYYHARYTGGYLTISKTISGVPSTDAAAWEKLGKLTFTVQKLVVTELADSFTGTVVSRSAQWQDVTGLTEISIKDFDGFDFENGTYTYTSETLLPAGTYRVVENGGDLSDLGYTWNLDGKDTVSSEVSIVADGASKSASLTNAYTGKTYTIIFDAGLHGQVQNQEGNYMESGSTTKYSWAKVTPEEKAAYYKWSSVVESGTGSTLRYTFTQNDYLEYLEEMTIPAPLVKADAGWTAADGGIFSNGDTAYTNIQSAYAAMNAKNATSITYTVDYTANEVNYSVDFYYQNADGTYPTTPTASVIRQAHTSDRVSVTDSDKTPNIANNTEKRTYHFDENSTSNALSAAVAGNGSTHLKVYFCWTAGVTYQYQPANLPAAVTEAYPLPADSDVYCSGAATTNRGAANGTAVQVANGTWTLAWDRLSAPMTAEGVTYTGTWTFTANGQSTAHVQFVDENGNDLWALSHAEPNPYTSTGDYETPYDFSSAETETAFQINGLTYAFSKDYDGTFDAGKDDEDVAYTGTLQPGGRTITRVYTAEAQTLTVTKLYDIDTLPGAFQVTITDNDANQAQIAVLTLASATVDGRTATWQTALPKGHSYTFTESGFSNGTNWSTELTARWLQQVSNTEQIWKDLTVAGFSFALPKVDGNSLAVELSNDYTYTPSGDDDEDSVVIPDEDTPTTDLPDEQTPTTELPAMDIPDEQTPTTELPVIDLPDEETPMAEAPKTGDSTGAWILAAGVSGLALIWLAISGKKRRDSDHQV